VNLGFIGLGNMGTRIVTSQLEAGFGMTLWARREASLEPFAGTEAKAASSPAEVGAASDVVGICVWDEHDVDQVLLGDDGVLAGLRPGGSVAIHSTISPSACARLQAEAASRGCLLVDAPVSFVGTPKLLVMVGGETEAVEACRPALDAAGDPVLHLGPIGSGQIAKLVNNTMLAATIGIGDSALDLGADLGLDRGALLTALSSGSARGTWSVFAAPRPAAAGMSGRTGEWARKDVSLTVELAQEAGLDLDRAVLDLGRRGADVVDGNTG
jgi:3-hydroxyisobutyrate dehydrogenase